VSKLNIYQLPAWLVIMPAPVRIQYWYVKKSVDIANSIKST